MASPELSRSWRAIPRAEVGASQAPTLQPPFTAWQDAVDLQRRFEPLVAPSMARQDAAGVPRFFEPPVVPHLAPAPDPMELLLKPPELFPESQRLLAAMTALLARDACPPDPTYEVMADC